MDRALVVVDESDAHERLFRNAAAFAGGADAELVVLSWLTPDEYVEYVDALESFGEVEHTTFDEPQAQEMAEQFAREFAEEALEGIDVAIDFEVEGIVTEEDDVPNVILDAAERLECDHVFVVGRRRSPAGKAIFGDVAQKIILNFDGLVTTATE